MIYQGENMNSTFSSDGEFTVSDLAMAQVPDIHPSWAEKDKEIGGLVGQNMIAISGGGIAAILMQETGLFTPLLLAAGLSFAAFAFMYMFLIKPHGKAKFVAFENENGP